MCHITNFVCALVIFAYVYHAELIGGTRVIFAYVYNRHADNMPHRTNRWDPRERKAHKISMQNLAGGTHTKVINM